MKVENGIGNRIQLLMKKENIPPQSFAQEIGITSGGLNHILSGRNKPRFDVLQKIIEKYKNLNLDWLLLGNPPMYKENKAILSADLFKENPINAKKDESRNISSIGELSLSENIDEIRIYFKNKTYLVFKLEK